MHAAVVWSPEMIVLKLAEKPCGKGLNTGDTGTCARNPEAARIVSRRSLMDMGIVGP